MHVHSEESLRCDAFLSLPGLSGRRTGLTADRRTTTLESVVRVASSDGFFFGTLADKSCPPESGTSSPLVGIFGRYCPALMPAWWVRSVESPGVQNDARNYVRYEQ